jgi:hypothetical protein
MMNRRAFLATLGAGVVAAPLMGEAQQAPRAWRIGVMVNLPRSVRRDVGL